MTVGMDSGASGYTCFVSGFTPASGVAFTVVTYGSKTESLAISGDPSFAASYGAAALIITAS